MKEIFCAAGSKTTRPHRQSAHGAKKCRLSERLAQLGGFLLWASQSRDVLIQGLM
jgi:hypothetical protein